MAQNQSRNTTPNTTPQTGQKTARTLTPEKTRQLRDLRVSQDPHAAVFFQNPYPVYARWHALGPYVFWEQYGFWCAIGFDAVSELLRDRRFGRQILHRYSREQLGWKPPPPHLQNFHAVEAHSLLCLEPPSHTRLRAHINRAFSARRVAAELPAIEALSHQLIDAFAPASEVELLQGFAAPLAAQTIARWLGVDACHVDQLLMWSHAMVKVYTLTQTLTEEHEADRAASEFAELLQGLITERRQLPQEDLLSQLCTTVAGQQPLSDAEIISMAVLLLNAGHEATVHQFGNAIRSLLRQPDGINAALTQLQNPAQADALLSELMRYDTPLHLFTRYALEPVELFDGVMLQPGDEVALLLGAANHDPRRFRDPGQFCPQRADGGHLSLGAGIHYCAGAALAKLELATGLRVLFERLPSLSLHTDPDFRDSYHFRGLQALWVNVQQ